MPVGFNATPAAYEGGWQKPIDQIVPGDRVIGENPIEAEDTTFGPVDPATRKPITLRAQKESGGYCHIEMLRPD